VETLGIRAVDARLPRREPGSQDDFLIRADKSPNGRGAELLGLAAAGDEGGGGVLAEAQAGRLSVLWVFGHDLFASRWAEAEVRAALGRVESLIFQGPNANRTSELAHLVVPSAPYTEREGTFTNFEGRVQRFWRALEPLGEARADWEVLAEVGQALGKDWRPTRAEHLFRELAAGVPAFAGLTYARLRDQGAPAAGAPAEARR
jgi:NADH-quinone oxidoreductase subunit G